MTESVQSTDKNLFPLDAERMVRLKFGELVYTHVFRACTEEEAREFFRAATIEWCLAVAAARGGGEGRDLEAPSRELYARLLLRAEGYRVKGGGELSALPGWQERIPLSHRMLALDRMTQVAPDESGAALEIDPEFDSTILSALGYTGLVHRFEPVTAQEQHEFKRDSTKAKAVGGSRSGASISPAEQNILIRFYNRKIRQVEGYSAGGAALSTREEIVARMDPFHKVAAMQSLFARVRMDDAEAQSDLAKLAGEAKRAMLETENAAGN